MKWFFGIILLVLCLGTYSTSNAEVLATSDLNQEEGSKNGGETAQNLRDESKKIPSPDFPDDVWTVGVEEDGIRSYGSDDKYTMGITVSHIFKAGQDECCLFGKLWRLADYLDDFIPAAFGLGEGADRPSPQFYWSHFGGSGFTPTVITNSAAIYDDRPYAALLFWSSGYVRDYIGAFSNRKKVELQFGLLGTPVGYWLQSGIHSVVAPNDMPQGWSHQIGNGGSPTFLLQENWIKDLITEGDSQYVGANFSYGYAAGYWVKVNAGLSLQLGTQADRDAQVGTLPKLTTTARYTAFSTNDQKQSPPRAKPTGFSLWANVDFNMYAYNEMLRGAWTGQNDVTLSPSQINPYIFQGTFGLDMSFLPKYIFCTDPEKHRLLASYNIRNNEITTAHGSNHSWVGIYFSSFY